MGERNFPPLLSRLQNRETNFQCGLAPSAIVEDRPIIHNAFIELLQLGFSGVYSLRNMYFSFAVFVVDEKTVGRLAEVASFAGHNGEAEKWLMLFARPAVAADPSSWFRTSIAPFFEAALELLGSIGSAAQGLEKFPGFDVSLRIFLFSAFADPPSQLTSIEVGVAAVHQIRGHAVFEL